MLVLMLRQFGVMSPVMELHSSCGLLSSRTYTQCICFMQFKGSGVTEFACTKIYIQNPQSDFAICIARKQACVQKWKLILSINLQKQKFCSHKGQSCSKISLSGSAGEIKTSLCDFNLPSFFNVCLPVLWLANLILYQVT